MYLCMRVCMYVFGALTRSWETVVTMETRLRSHGWILSLHVQTGSAVHTNSYSPSIGDPSSCFKDVS